MTTVYTWPNTASQSSPVAFNYGPNGVYALTNAVFDTANAALSLAIPTIVLSGQGQGAVDFTNISKNRRAVVSSVRRDYAVDNLATGTWYEIVTATSGAITKLNIFDSSAYTFELATGLAGSETRLCFVPPGGVELELQIAAGTRLAIKTTSAVTVDSGELVATFLS